MVLQQTTWCNHRSKHHCDDKLKTLALEKENFAESKEDWPKMSYEKAWQENDGYIENTMLPFLLDEDVIPSPQLGLKHSIDYKSKDDNSFIAEKIDYDTAWLIWKTWMKVNASSAPTAEYIQELPSLHLNIPERLCILSTLRYIGYATDVCYWDACCSTIEKVE